MILITGCGRSGTTLLFDLLRANLPEETTCLNEPRLLHLPSLDIWSPNPSPIDGPCPSYLQSLRQILPTSQYLEKTPEHALRPLFLSFLRTSVSLTQINIVRNWPSVALSISRFCCLDWYGYDDAKWA
jgi:hypothetical protein